MRAVRPLNALWVLLVYPFFEDETLEDSDQKSVERKIA